MFVDAERRVVVVGCGLLYEEQRGADGVVSGVPLLRTAHDERVEYRLQEVVGVFDDMNQCMQKLFDALKEIVSSTEQADKEREDTLAAVKNISDIIAETAEGTKLVQNVAAKLQENVDTMNQTAQSLGDNMNDLKSEISVFKTE